jgi:hypothetical protein
VYSYNDGPPKAEASIRSSYRGICGGQCDMKQAVFRILNLLHLFFMYLLIYACTWVFYLFNALMYLIYIFTFVYLLLGR